jgi:hypothetical protein
MYANERTPCVVVLHNIGKQTHALDVLLVLHEQLHQSSLLFLAQRFGLSALRAGNIATLLLVSPMMAFAEGGPIYTNIFLTPMLRQPSPRHRD